MPTTIPNRISSDWPTDRLTDSMKLCSSRTEKLMMMYTNTSSADHERINGEIGCTRRHCSSAVGAALLSVCAGACWVAASWSAGRWGSCWVMTPPVLPGEHTLAGSVHRVGARLRTWVVPQTWRSEEHTSELQSRGHLV